MSPKKTLIFALILVAVAGFIYFYEMPKTKEDQSAKDLEKSIMDVDWDSVDRITMERRNQTIVLEKTGDQWKITKPVSDLADNYGVQSIINGFRFAKVDRRLDKIEQSLGIYGLDPPQAKVAFRIGTMTKTIEFGSLHNIQGSVFIKLAASPEILLVSDSLLETTKKGLDEIRESKLFRDETTGPTRISVIQGKSVMELVKKENDETEWEWRFEKPFEDLADEKATDDYVRKITQIQAAGFLDDLKKSDPIYGFDDPLLKIRVEFPGEEENSPIERTLLVSKNSNQNGEYYATMDNVVFVALLMPGSVMDLQVQPKELRDRHVVHFQEKSVSKIRLQSDGRLAIISHLGPEWSFENGDLADPTKCQSFLESLKELQGEMIDEGRKVKTRKYGISARSDFIELFDKDDNRIAKITLGKINSKLGSQKLAMQQSDKLKFFNLAIENLTFWPKSVDDLVNETQIVKADKEKE